MGVTDITEHPTAEGKVYCAAVLDVFSRTVVGWSIADHMRAELVVDALLDDRRGVDRLHRLARRQRRDRRRAAVHDALLSR
ncbi:DDE-type integrase/transposase/recombinase [Geodermatophilus sp. SYSU D00779]